MIAPHWARAATLLKIHAPDVGVAKVDAEKNTKLQARFGIQGFPTIKVSDHRPCSRWAVSVCLCLCVRCSQLASPHCQRLHVSALCSFVSLQWFVDGEEDEYGGGRADHEIVAWVKKKTGPPCKMLNTTGEKLSQTRYENLRKWRLILVLLLS